MTNTWINSLYQKRRMLCEKLLDENGQDLVEYAAVIVLVVLALTGGMTTLATQINAAMVSVGNLINTTLG